MRVVGVPHTAKATVSQKAVSVCAGNSLTSLPLSFNTMFVHFKLQKRILFCCFRNKNVHKTGIVIIAVNSSYSFKTLRGMMTCEFNMIRFQNQAVRR